MELEVVAGLAPVLETEVAVLLGSSPTVISGGRTAVRVGGPVDLTAVLRARVARSAYLVVHVPARRPNALLGEQHLGNIVAAATAVTSLHLPESFSGFRIAAAGSETAVFARLGAELERRLGLPRTSRGQLLVRVRRGPAGGWDVLVSLTPRPLWARPWHRPGVAGSLEPSVAAAMLLLAGVSESDRFLDPTCGSGTLLAERCDLAPAVTVIGADRDDGPLGTARNVLRSAGARAVLARGDASRLPLRAGTIDRIAANLPWGHRFGSHQGNEALYPAILDESARVSAPDCCLVILTHDLSRFDQALGGQRHWGVARELQIELAGHHPKIWVLRRNADMVASR